MRTTTRYAPNGMVASIDDLATGAGVEMLHAGGTAADAAVAASAVLAVTGPHVCGMGGDLFALVHRPGDDAPACLNASGRAGSGADPERLRAEGVTSMPLPDDIRAATVPGCVDGWVALHERFGRLALADVLRPAMALARDGFPTSPLLAPSLAILRDVPGCGDLVGDGRRRAGDRITRPGVAAALDGIAAGGREAFYEGEFGRGLLQLGAGEYTAADLRAPLANWVDPLAVDVWGHVVWTVPPSSQGYLTLLSAAIAAGLPLPDVADDAWAHLLIESARAAAFDRQRVLHEHADVRPLLQPDEVATRRALVDPSARATLPAPVALGDTMYLCAVDADRMGVSLIQSNASGFGCHVFEPTTGIGLHNRGLGFSLEPGHPAEYGPGRRPPHTLAPALITRPDGSLRATIGTMGGDAQPQVLLQLVTRLLRHRHSPGRTIGAPRWALTGKASGFDTWDDANAVGVDIEAAAAASWRDGLVTRGHDVTVNDGLAAHFGHAHVIEVRDDGMLAGAADPRALIGSAAGH
jgi:gamma-glutamyltranspeptidase/glutathione hydrolase